MPSLASIADHVYRWQLGGGVHVTVYLFCAGRQAWQYACTCTSPGWVHVSKDRRHGPVAYANEYSALAAALGVLRGHWHGLGVKRIAAGLDEAIDNLWL